MDEDYGVGVTGGSRIFYTLEKKFLFKFFFTSQRVELYLLIFV